MTSERFEQIAQEVMERLPAQFIDKIDNVRIVVEDDPSDETLHQMHTSKTSLLGLYQGIPLTHRNTWYGTSPTIPDTIFLYQRNIESLCRTEEELIAKIYEVLLHEIGHYFGMNETEIRRAMRNYK
jgi:predicted Zn-dependent protease with MMP-like domain